MKSSLRGAIVVVAICSWFAISNHCVFAALATNEHGASRQCPFHSKPAKQEKPSTGAQCCKIFARGCFGSSKGLGSQRHELFRLRWLRG